MFLPHVADNERLANLPRTINQQNLVGPCREILFQSPLNLPVQHFSITFYYKNIHFSITFSNVF
jgi:hypothetical protein